MFHCSGASRPSHCSKASRPALNLNPLEFTLNPKRWHFLFRMFLLDFRMILA